MTTQPQTPAVAALPVWTPEAPAIQGFDTAEPDELGTSPADANLDPESTATSLEGAGLSPLTHRVRPAPIAPKRTNSVGVLLGISAMVAVGGIGFAAGRLGGGGASTSNTQANNGGFAPNASGGPGGFGGIRPDGSGGPGVGGAASVSGTVVSVGADSFTVKLASGETVTIATGSTTTYHSQTSGTSADLASGESVTVQTSGRAATPNASASAGTTSRTATSVTITAK